MILSRCNFFSNVLKSHVEVEVLLPNLPDNDALSAGYDQLYPGGRRHGVLYLLHGALEDATSWLRHTRIEDYAEAHQVAVVMPSGQNGFYVNALFGMNYYDFITEELPRFAEYTFPISSAPADRLIAGASMGGYGAARCALGRPDAYAAFGVFSGAVDPGALEPRMVEMGFDFFRYDLLFGGAEKVEGSGNDLFLLASSLKHAPQRPDAYIYCGSGDTNNHDMNLRLCHTLQQSGFHACFSDGPGLHDWAYWDTCVNDFLTAAAGRK